MVFQALASRTRRRILDIVRDRPGIAVGQLCEHFEMSRIGVMKHLQVLEQAQLLHSERAGKKRQLYFNVVPIQLIYDRWTDQFSALWASGLTAFKRAMEGSDGDDEQRDQTTGRRR